MIMLSERADFLRGKLEVSGDYRTYSVEYAIVDGLTWLKTSEQYTNHEFNEYFGFREGRDFVKGKVIVVNPEKSKIRL